MRVIGNLSLSAGPGQREKQLLEGLHELGWREDKTFRVEYRWAGNDVRRLPALAEELTRLKVDVLVVWSMPAIRAAKEATSVIPIIMGNAEYPQQSGMVASLAHPGGNVTGVSMTSQALDAGRVEILKELIPRLRRVALLAASGDPIHRIVIHEAQEAGRAAKVRVVPYVIDSHDEFSTAFAAMRRDRMNALLVSPVFSGYYAHGPKIAESATQNNLPSATDGWGYPEAGGLLYYGADSLKMYRQVATFVDQLLNGARPADLPVKQPPEAQLVINMKTAKQLRLKVPDKLLLRANKVIE